MLGTNIWSVVGFGAWKLFIDGLLFGAHIQKRLSPARGTQNWGEDRCKQNYTLLNFALQWGD